MTTPDDWRTSSPMEALKTYSTVTDFARFRG